MRFLFLIFLVGSVYSQDWVNYQLTISKSFLVEGNNFKCTFEWTAPSDDQLLLTFGANPGDVPFTWELISEASSEVLINNIKFKSVKMVYRLKALKYGIHFVPPFPITLEGEKAYPHVPTFAAKKVVVLPKGLLEIVAGLAGILLISILARRRQQQKKKMTF